MDERRPRKHKDFIEPGSKEDREMTETVNEALDGWVRQSKERHRREKEEGERERQRRVEEGLPCENDCYFVRFTGGMHVRDEDLCDLWEAGKVAVHLTEDGTGSGPSRSGKLNYWKDYPPNERMMVSTLLGLSEKGGYVWFEGRSGEGAKAGVVRPGTRIEPFGAQWSERYYPKYNVKPGTKTVLRTLQLEKVRAVGPEEAMMLRASRPVMPDHVGTNLRSWCPACGTSRLVSLVEGSPTVGWNDLPLCLQLTVCTDFLRDHDNPEYPKLKRVLLTPTAGPEAGPDKDVDIYGMAEDGTEVFAQVPFRRNRDREGFEARKKAGQLRKYRGADAKLICIVPGSRDDADDLRLFGRRAPVVLDGVLFIPVGEILKWIERQPAYAEKVFFP
ncbi:MAG: hypothetical protein M3P49_01800 [Actinomycetota bacterium]|nr:hypothetical protein [Actinomycetota bacterium]